MMQKTNLKKTLSLAPMDSITDICYRELAEELDADFTISELTSVDSIISKKVNLQNRIKKGQLKKNIVQIFGSKPEKFAKATKILNTQNIDEININFGCPSNSLIKSKSGSYLLQEPELMISIIKAVLENFDKKVSIKMRIGFNEINIFQLIEPLCKTNIQYIILHGRTAKQGYSGKSNWQIIQEVYQKIDKPLIGNGDINENTDIDKYFNYADGLMIGRAAIGNPAIFRTLKNKEKLKITKEQQKELFFKYYKKFQNINYHKPTFKLKQQALYFFNRFSGSKNIRKKITSMKTEEEIINFIKTI